MSHITLPQVHEDKVFSFPHFPSRMHAAVFRLWETVSAKKIADALQIPYKTIKKAADDMGLPAQKNIDIWSERGYITTIKNAWHILPYEQLLKILDVNADEFAVMLRNEDFLSTKLGGFKPYCETIREEPLTDEQKIQLNAIKQTIKTEFSEMFSLTEPFDFFNSFLAKEPLIETEEKKDELRLIYSYCGLFGNTLDQDIRISFPEEMLAKYQATGVNGVWLPATLYEITPFPFDETYSVGWESRQERLQELVALTAKYGIKVFLYLNEPRAMPLKFFEKYPEMKGRVFEGYASMCQSDARVLEYLKNAVCALCKNVPGLGGFFTINLSENLTHCKSSPLGKDCHNCKNTPTQKLVSDVIRTISDASRSVDPTIKTIAWTWAWDTLMTEEERLDCIDRLPKEVIIQSNSEAMIPFVIGGVKGKVIDYSMSIPGPGDLAKNIWNYAKEKGHEVSAKVQVNVTWECSTMPFLPVFDLIREHMTALNKEKVKHLMLSWTLGGYPSVNLKVATGALDDPSEHAYDELLKREYGKYAPVIKKAAKIFSDAFRHFPFDVRNLYYGPQNAGPSNLLYEKPSGFEATMTCFAYDDLDKWRADYPKEVYRNQLLKLSETWHEGLKLLDTLPDSDFKQMAWGGYALFYSSFLQTDFIMSRQTEDIEKLQYILSEERKLALIMYELMNKNPLVGYEAANHYYFNKSMLAEKVICCDYLSRRFNQ